MPLDRMTLVTSSMTFQHALAYFQQNRQEQAAAICLKLLRQRSDDFNALHLLGLVEMQRGRLPEAIERFQQSVSINRNQPAAHLNLSHALLQSGKPRAAL